MRALSLSITAMLVLAVACISTPAGAGVLFVDDFEGTLPCCNPSTGPNNDSATPQEGDWHTPAAPPGHFVADSFGADPIFMRLPAPNGTRRVLAGVGAGGYGYGASRPENHEGWSFLATLQVG